MSLQWQLSRVVPADTAVLGQGLFATTNPYRQIGDRFDGLFPDESTFASLYEGTGRGAISPLLLTLVTVFQQWEAVPDRQAAELVVSRIDWKYALHLPLTYCGFHFTDLSAFRTRLLDKGEERWVFDQTVQKLTDLGVITKNARMRTDSTHIIAVVERLGRMELVSESIRVALGAVTALVPAWAEQNIPSPFQETYGERQTEYGLSDTQVEQKLRQAGRDGFWLLAQWDRAVPVAPDRVPQEVETLRTVLQQQFLNNNGHTPRSKRPAGRGVIDSPHEPEARSKVKRGKPWVGYMGQITETCDDDQPHLITDVDVTDVYANDSPQVPVIQGRLQDHGMVPEEHYVDQGYMSGQNLVSSAQAGITLMGKPLGDTSGPEGFRQSDFRIDEERRQAVCPAGQSSVYWHEEPAPPGGDAAVDIRFDGAVCQHCPSFGRCTASARGRSLQLHPYRQALEERRAQAKTLTFQEQMHRRAGIEGTISELVRRHRLRYARYRGQVKVLLQACFTAVAVNLKRLLRWWAEPRPHGAVTATS